MKSRSIQYIVGAVVIVFGIALAFAVKTKDGFRGGGGGGDGGGAHIGGGGLGGGLGGRVGGMTGFPGESLHRGYYTGYLPNLSSSTVCKTDSDCGESTVCRNGSCV